MAYSTEVPGCSGAILSWEKKNAFCLDDQN